MDKRTRELIAVGASIAAHCQPCLAYHVGKAKDLGIHRRLIREAISVGQMVEKGSMFAMRDCAKRVFDSSAPDARACCGGNVSPGGKGCCS